MSGKKKVIKQLAKGRTHNGIFGLPPEILRAIIDQISSYEAVRLRRVCRLAKSTIGPNLRSLEILDDPTDKMLQKIVYFTALRQLSFGKVDLGLSSREPSLSHANLMLLTKLTNLETLTISRECTLWFPSLFGETIRLLTTAKKRPAGGFFPNLKRLDAPMPYINISKPIGKWDTAPLKIPDLPDDGFTILCPKLSEVIFPELSHTYEKHLIRFAPNFTVVSIHSSSLFQLYARLNPMHLVELSIIDHQFPLGVTWFRDFSRLTKLTFAIGNASWQKPKYDSSLDVFVNNVHYLTNLEVLELRWSRDVIPRSLRSLTRLRSLRCTTLGHQDGYVSGHVQMSIDDLNTLLSESLVGLSELRLDCLRLTTKTFEIISNQLTRLNYLYLNHIVLKNDVTDPYKLLGSMTKLRVLSLGESLFEESAIDWFFGLTNLRELRLQTCAKLTPNCIQTIATKFPNLTYLDLKRNTPIQKYVIPVPLLNRFPELQIDTGVGPDTPWCARCRAMLEASWNE